MTISSNVPHALATCVPVPKSSTPKKTSADDHTRALNRYTAGNELLNKGDFEGALSLFLQSRDLWPKRSNTKNAAICHFELGQFPEALAMYEELIEHFADDLDPAERSLIEQTIAELRAKVIVAHIHEKTGTFAIDDENCGALPRAEPVYLMPGTHVFHWFRSGKPEVWHGFDGHAGENLDVELPAPPPPPPPTIDIPPPLRPSGKLFIQSLIGPALAPAGMGSFSKDELTFSAGIMAQGYGGYRLSNGLILSLNAGFLYYQESRNLKQSFGNYEYSGTHDVLFRSPFGGVLAGWGTGLGRVIDIWFLGGVGVMNTQSKNAVTASLASPGQNALWGVGVSGRQVSYSAPGYAKLNIGAALHLGHFRLGVSLESIFLFVSGTPLSDVYLIPGYGDNHCSSAMDCVPIARFLGRVPYSWSKLLIPQFTIGFE